MTDPNHEPVHPVENPIDTNILVAAASKPTRRTEDRLNVPKSSCKAAGFLPGNTAYVVDHDPAGVVQKPVLVLLKAKPENPLGECTVSKDGRIRVTPAALKACGLEGNKFEFDGGEGKIVVRRAP